VVPLLRIPFLIRLLDDCDLQVLGDARESVVVKGRNEVLFSPSKMLSLTKKKLSGDEIAEINRLYRIIGRCEQKLAKLQK
jgi:hypothetical protein